MKKQKFLTKTTRIGTYTLVMSLIVLAAIILVNVVALKIPGKYTKLDITALNLYTLSETTKEAVPKIEDKINIYLLCADGTDASGSSVNNIPSLSVFLGKYVDLNENIKFQIIDPVAQPTFQDKYTSEELENYSIIIESEKRAKIINFVDLYYYYSQSFGRMSAEEYSQYAAYLQYTGDGSITLYFDGESIITSALDFVTTDSLPVVYALNGHGETEFSNELINKIETENMTVKPLSLLSSEIPTDAECVIINTPQTDINTDEAEKLITYLKNGGNVVLTTVYQYLDLPNLMGVLEKYGMTAQKGMIIEESSSNFYSGYPYYLLPTINTASEITSSLAADSYYMFMPFSHGLIKTENKPEAITITPLFTTTASSYTIDASSETVEKTEESVTGAFDVALSAEDSETGAKLVWLGSPALTDNFNSVTSGGNYAYFISALNWLCERDRIVETIPSTSLEATTLIVSEASANLWAAILIIVIPLSFAIIGVVRWYVRRKR